MLYSLLDMTTRSIQVEIDPQRLRPSDIPIAIGNSGLLRKVTGWQPAVPIEDTLRGLLGFWRRQVEME
jgi:GDP-4-dehydro-6-deoxy-D-mannose reductase